MLAALLALAGSPGLVLPMFYPLHDRLPLAILAEHLWHVARLQWRSDCLVWGCINAGIVA